MQVRHRASWFWLIYLVLALWFSFWAIEKVSSNNSIVYLFWLVFPILNVPLDWLSLGVTRGLLQSICSGKHDGTRGFLWALLDLVIAFVLLLLMATVLLTAIDFANDLRLTAGKDMVLNLVDLLKGMENNPANPDFYWIYFMLFSTLLPTLVHFALAGASVVLWFPAKIRHELVKKWHNDADKKLEIWFYVSIMPVLGFAIAPTVLFYSLWWLLSSFDIGIALIHFFQFFVES